MRLTNYQIESFKRVATEVFGPDAHLFLFGSRINDSLRGGDIDFYVTGLNQSLEQQLDAKLRFLFKIKQEIGEQRIDVVFAPRPGQAHLPIHKIAEQTGIPL